MVLVISEGGNQALPNLHQSHLRIEIILFLIYRGSTVTRS
jgi:hypothetical protein